MYEVKNFDKKELEWIRKEIDAVLDLVGENHGIKLAIGSIRYTDKTFKCQLSGVVPESGQESMSAKQIEYYENYKSQCMFYGMTESELGTKKTIKGKSYKLIGLNSRAEKFPLVLECAGKTIRATMNFWKNN